MFPAENWWPFSCKAGLLSPEKEFRAESAPRGHPPSLALEEEEKGRVLSPAESHAHDPSTPPPRVSLPARNPDLAWDLAEPKHLS